MKYFYGEYMKKQSKRNKFERFLDKFVQSMKGANLNRLKRSAILYKVIEAAGMSPQQLMADIQKIKKEM